MNTQYTPTDPEIERRITDYQNWHRGLGADVDVRVDGAGYDYNGCLNLVVFDTEYVQHLLVTFHADGSMETTPLYQPVNQQLLEEHRRELIGGWEIELVRRIRRGLEVKTVDGPLTYFCGVTWDDVRSNPYIVRLPEDESTEAVAR